MRNMKRLLCFALTMAVFVVLVLPLSASAVGNDQSYSYNYDEFDNALPCPDPYEVKSVLTAMDFGLTHMKDPNGMFIWEKGERLFVCDTGNSRILEFDLSGEQVQLAREITRSVNGQQWSLSKPYDIFVDETGKLFIADYGNERVLILNNDLEYLSEIKKPNTALFDGFTYFRPTKLVVTAGGRIYCVAQGVNKGLMEFNESGEFIGYVGAAKVTFDWADYIWKLLSTDAQRAQLDTFVPTEFSNVALDYEGFIMSTISVFQETDLANGSVDVVRRLNLKGSNILNENGGEVIGEKAWTWETGASRLIDVTVLPDNTYYVLDSAKQRIFAYDEQGYSLYAFGGYGNREGYFIQAKALDHFGYDLYVLDGQKGTITVLGQTDYGANISNAIFSYNSGDYDSAYQAWQNVLQENGNYTLAYSGIGRILLRNGEYEEALEYLKYAKNRYYYSKAFQLYRKEIVEAYIGPVVLVVVAIVVIVLTTKVVLHMRREVEYYKEHHNIP